MDKGTKVFDYSCHEVCHLDGGEITLEMPQAISLILSGFLLFFNGIFNHVPDFNPLDANKMANLCRAHCVISPPSR
jgi:hypothetical protein